MILTMAYAQGSILYGMLQAKGKYQMSEYIIQDNSGAFLGQNGVWVGEYPDACIFTDYLTAEKEYFYTLENGSLTDPIELVENYGLESEESLLCMTSAEFRKIGLSKSHFTS